MRILWDDFVLNISGCCEKYIAKNTWAASYIFLCHSHLILFSSLFWHYDVDLSLRMRSYEDPVWMSTTGNDATSSTTVKKYMWSFGQKIAIVMATVTVLEFLT